MEPARKPSKREAIVEMCRYIISLEQRGEAAEAERITDALYAAQPEHEEVIRWNLEHV